MLLQMVLSVAVLLVGWLVSDGWSAVSAAFGVGVSWFNSGLLRWRMPARRVVSDPGFHLRSVVRSVVERFAGVALLFWLGLAIIHFSPLWLLVGFVVGQMAWLVAGIEWFDKNR
jgi:hypothetical protein